MGIGNVVINVGWKLVVVAIYAALYELTPLRLDPHNPLTWIALFFADDLAYYWFHRVSATRAACSGPATSSTTPRSTSTSRTALRQTWVPMTYFPFWLPLPLLGLPGVDGPARPGVVADLPVLDPHGAHQAAAAAGSRPSSTRPRTTASTTG